MEEPTGNAVERTGAEASKAAQQTGVEPTASQGTSKQRRHTKKRRKASTTATADDQPADGGFQSSSSKHKKTKRDSKSKTTSIGISTCEGQPELSSAPALEALAETGARAAAKAQSTPPVGEPQQSPAPIAAPPQPLAALATGTLAQSTAQLHGEDIMRGLPTGTYVRQEATAETRLHLLLGSVVVLLVVLAVCVLVGQQLFTTADESLMPCTSESCVAHSKRLQATINTSVDPCHDFYSFVCGGWQSAFPHLSVLDKINEDAIKSNLKEVSDDMWRVGRANRLYYKCTTPEVNDVAENVFTLTEFKQFLGLYWPEHDQDPITDHPLDVMVYMAASYDVNFLFNLDIGFSNASGDVIILRRGHQGAVWRDRIARPLNHIEYATVVREHLNALDVSSVRINPAQLQDLERAFLTAIQPTAHSQQSWFMVGALDKTPSIRKGTWLSALRNHLGFTITDYSWVVFEDSNILDSIEILFETYSSLDLLIGISWMFIQSHLWAVAGKPELMFRDNIEEKKQRACLEFVNSRFGLLSSAHFVTMLFPTPETRQELADFFISVKNAFKLLTKNSSWINSQSREVTKRKIDTMAIRILPAEPFFSALLRDVLYNCFSSVESMGFVENWLVNISLQYKSLRRHKHFKDIYSKRRNFWHAPYSYTYLLNEVNAPFAAIEPPLFYQSGPFAVNYASAGSLIAKEIAKSIDPEGTRIDDRGENVKWWGESHSAEYGQRISCDLGEKEKSRFNLFPTIPALEASFFAYKLAVVEEAVIKGRFIALRLAGIEQYTEEQVFFMTYCYTLCSKEDSSSAVHQCNVPLRNSFHFAEAFKCPPGSPMNPREKCTFFGAR